MANLRQFLYVVMWAILSVPTVPTELAAEPSKRVALVIGNSDYEFVPNLRNPVNDATDIAAALTRLGFEVTARFDLDYREIRLALRDFAASAADADISLLYFAGHGIEIAKTNYLIPVNAQLKSDRDADFEAITLDTVLSAITASKGLKIVLVDACRNNPFRANITRTVATRSIGRGLTRIDPGGVLVGYAAREGTLALDGDGRNSPYAMALLKHLEQPGLEIGKLFRKVRDTVFLATGGQQEPYTYGSLPGADIFLAPAVAQTGLPQNAGQTLSSVNPTIASDFAAADGRNTVREWEKFIGQYAAYPENALVGIAQAKRGILQDAAEARQREKARKPWLIPAAGLNGYSIELTLGERKLVQKSLSYMGFDIGVIDGQFGPRTRRAISSARFQNGLSSGDNINRALLKVLPNVPTVEALMSKTAVLYKDVELPPDFEPRLRKAMEVLKHRRLRFGYFRGHLYIAVLASSSWFSSGEVARNAGGHLVTIADAKENQFVYQLFSSDKRFVRETPRYLFGPLIGLHQVDKSREPAGGWAWVTGEALSYQNWSKGNPDNYQGRQHYGKFFKTKKNYPRGGGASFWDDTSGSARGYIIEIE